MSSPGHLVQPGLEVEDPNTLEPNPPLHPHLATWSSQALSFSSEERTSSYSNHT